MGNVIQIKRGNGKPQNGMLQPYELGIDKQSGVLYIGTQTGEAMPVFSGGTATSQEALPTTRLLKSESSTDDDQTLQIYCYNLKPGTSYVIELYTMQKKRGNASRYWRHPANLDPDDSSINWAQKSGTYTGYKNLVGHPYGADDSTYEEYEAPPEWMVNGGVLQTEWSFVPEESAEMFEIKLNSWVSDLLKYHPEEDSWVLMGIHAKAEKRRHYCRQFQFRIKTPLGAVGPTENTLCLSGASATPQGEVTIPFFSIK